MHARRTALATLGVVQIAVRSWWEECGLANQIGLHGRTKPNETERPVFKKRQRNSQKEARARAETSQRNGQKRASARAETSRRNGPKRASARAETSQRNGKAKQAESEYLRA